MSFSELVGEIGVRDRGGRGKLNGFMCSGQNYIFVIYFNPKSECQILLFPSDFFGFLLDFLQLLFCPKIEQKLVSDFIISFRFLVFFLIFVQF